MNFKAISEYLILDMHYYLYILHAPKYQKFYIGQTNDLERRLVELNFHSENSFTSKFRPWILMTSIAFNTRAQAMAAEKYLKKKPRDFIRKVINDHSLRQYIIEKYEAIE